MNFSKKKGFTLIELAMFMGIFSILLFILTQIFVDALEVRREIETFSATQQDGSFILSRLKYDISRAQTITTPANLGLQTTTLLIAIDGINYTYDLQNDNLIVTNNNGTNQLNSFDTVVSNLFFTRLGNPGGKNTVRFSFTLTSKTINSKGPEIKNFRSSANLR